MSGLIRRCHSCPCKLISVQMGKCSAYCAAPPSVSVQDGWHFPAISVAAVLSGLQNQALIVGGSEQSKQEPRDQDAD